MWPCSSREGLGFERDRFLADTRMEDFDCCRDRVVSLAMGVGKKDLSARSLAKLTNEAIAAKGVDHHATSLQG